MVGLVPFGFGGQDVERLFSGFNPRALAGSYRVEAIEDGVKIIMDMPGVKPDDVTVNFQDGYLTVRGERNEVKEEKDENGDIVSREVNISNYSNRFNVGDRFNIDALDAKIEHGVLTITAPFAEHIKPRTIQVNVKSETEETTLDSEKTLNSSKNTVTDNNNLKIEDENKDVSSINK